jgi:hypothetical protein
MHPLILVGFDLVVSVLLILLGMFVVWSRFHTQPEGQGSGEIAATLKTIAMDTAEPRKFSVEEPHDETEFGDVTQRAATLEKKGCSTEEIARRLQIPTREVELVLAMSKMTRAGTVDRGVTVGFPLNPDAASPV